MIFLQNMKFCVWRNKLHTKRHVLHYRYLPTIQTESYISHPSHPYNVVYLRKTLAFSKDNNELINRNNVTTCIKVNSRAFFLSAFDKADALRSDTPGWCSSAMYDVAGGRWRRWLVKIRIAQHSHDCWHILCWIGLHCITGLGLYNWRGIGCRCDASYRPPIRVLIGKDLWSSVDVQMINSLKAAHISGHIREVFW